MVDGMRLVGGKQRVSGYSVATNALMNMRVGQSRVRKAKMSRSTQLQIIGLLFLIAGMCADKDILSTILFTMSILYDIGFLVYLVIEVRHDL